MSNKYIPQMTRENAFKLFRETAPETVLSHNFRKSASNFDLSFKAMDVFYNMVHMGTSMGMVDRTNDNEYTITSKMLENFKSQSIIDIIVLDTDIKIFIRD